MESTYVAYSDHTTINRKKPRFFQNPSITADSGIQNGNGIDGDEFFGISPSPVHIQQLINHNELIRYESDDIDIYASYGIGNNNGYYNYNAPEDSNIITTSNISGNNCTSTNSNWKLSQFYYHKGKFGNNLADFNVETELSNIINSESYSNRNNTNSTNYNEVQPNITDSGNFSYSTDSFPTADFNDFAFSNSSMFLDSGYSDSSSPSSSSVSLTNSLESNFNSPELISPLLFDDADIMNLESIHSGYSYFSTEPFFQKQFHPSQSRFEFPTNDVTCGSIDQPLENERSESGFSWNNVYSSDFKSHFSPNEINQGSEATVAVRGASIEESARTAELIRRNMEICQILSPFRRYKELLQRRQKSKPVGSQQFVRRKFSLMSAINVPRSAGLTKPSRKRKRHRGRQDMSDPSIPDIYRPNVSVRRWQSEVWTKLHIQERNKGSSNNPKANFVNFTSHQPQISQQQSHGYKFERNNCKNRKVYHNGTFENNNNRRSPPPMNVNLVSNDGDSSVIFH